MTPEAAPCDFCHVIIPARDFESGKAVVLLRKRYCTKCMAIAVKNSKDRHIAPSPQFRTPQVRPPPASPLSRRRHERKDCSIPVELSVFLDNGRLFDRGEAVIWNVSLSGALLRAILLPEKALPVVPHHLGIRVLSGPLKDFQVLGRPVRFVHSEDGLHVAMQFVRVEEAQLKRLRKLF
ncbi:MAG TPA: PilZ domain-containing protein [Planctomycetota bacterium]|nr:PilZ domain-containing protein [Planctomycetota bacterium]